jgi:hypothetical protein
MKCNIPIKSGRFCGNEATELVLRRGVYVCVEHADLGVTVAEFRRRIEEAMNENEVKRIVLHDQELLIGSQREIEEALNFAFARELHFAGPAEGIPAFDVAFA